eukprot:1013110-Amphidinium_carterae.1
MLSESRVVSSRQGGWETHSTGIGVSMQRVLWKGDQVTDHDLALAYILENYPALLPSFKYLTPAQRAPVLFTQAVCTAVSYTHLTLPTILLV